MIARHPRILAFATAWSATLLLAAAVLAADTPTAVTPEALTLTATPMTVGRAARGSFAPDGPVWIALSLRSRGGADTLVMVRRYEPGGDQCRLVAGYHGTAVDVPGPKPVTGGVYQVRVGAADTVVAEFPLSEYVRVKEAGLVPVMCGIEVTSPDGDRNTVSTTTVVRFGRRLGAAASRRLAAELNRLMASNDETDRVRVVRGLRVVDTTIAVPLLERAMADSSERVRVAAAVIAVDLDGNAGARRIVDEARRSGSDRVRRAVVTETRWRESRAREARPARD